MCRADKRRTRHARHLVPENCRPPGTNSRRASRLSEVVTVDGGKTWEIKLGRGRHPRKELILRRRQDAAPAPSGFAEIVSDDFSVLHAQRIHGCFSSQSFWKAGSPRNGSQAGSSLRRAGVRQLAYGISRRCCSLGIALFLSPTNTSTNAKLSSPRGPSTASLLLGSSVIARSASVSAAPFWPSTARVTESTCAKAGLSGSFLQ